MAPRSSQSMPSLRSRAASTCAGDEPLTHASRCIGNTNQTYDRRTTCRQRRHACGKPSAPVPTVTCENRARERRLYADAVERRIFGLENEYGVTCTLRGQRRLSPDEVARYLFRRVVSWGRSSNVFL